MAQEEKPNDLTNLAKLAPDYLQNQSNELSANFDVPPPEIVAAILPQFDQFEYCGRGGMGIVYQCRQKELDRKIAVKILPDSLGQDLIFSLRFEKEAKIIASLSHPNIIKVYDYSITNELSWFSMEYIEGGTLAEQIPKFHKDQPRTLKILSEICSAIDFAHSKGILHRDLKPINILLTDLQSNSSAIITDFGLAFSNTSQNTQLTITGFNIAHNIYMAPELHDSGSISEATKASDLYAIAVIAYQMLTNEKPVGAFSYPSEIRNCPQQVDATFKMALSPDPRKRHHCSMDFFNELKEALTEEKGSLDTNLVTQKKKTPADSAKSIWEFLGVGILFTLFLSVFLSSGGNNFTLVEGGSTKQFHNAIGLIIGGLLMHVIWISVSIFLWKNLNHLESCPSKKLLRLTTASICSINFLIIFLAVID